MTFKFPKHTSITSATKPDNVDPEMERFVRKYMRNHGLHSYAEAYEWMQKYGRYEVLVGFNTKQPWVYDEWADVYIDPPAEVLDSLPEGNPVDGWDDAEAALYDIVTTNPDWLHDENYWYDGDTDI